MNHIAVAAAATAVFVGAGTGALTKTTAPAQSDVANPMIAGQAMLMSASIMDNAARSPEHHLFVAAVKDAGLSGQLAGNTQLTVFAPTDQAFTSMPASRADMLMGSDKSALQKTMRYMIVPGRWDSQALLKLVNENGGEAKLKTIEGGTLTVSLNGPTNIVLRDETGATADIAIYDIYQANGVMQVIDHVVMPKMKDEGRYASL